MGTQHKPKWDKNVQLNNIIYATLKIKNINYLWQIFFHKQTNNYGDSSGMLDEKKPVSSHEVGVVLLSERV